MSGLIYPRTLDDSDLEAPENKIAFYFIINLLNFIDSFFLFPVKKYGHTSIIKFK